MNLKNKMIMEEYRESKDKYEKLGNTVESLLNGIISDNKIQILGLEKRIKTEKSLEGKLSLKGDKYLSLQDITDILGARIVCVFSDDVDVVAKYVEEIFDIDKENSIDKRKSLHTTEFGYLSLHYICSLPKNIGYDDELCDIKFEIQIRSGLQHIWAVIDHDIGYKSDFEIPAHLRRCFSRIAGLLELADDEFARLRDKIAKYEIETRERIANNQADDILIDRISLNEYVNHNKCVLAFFDKVSKVYGIEITKADASIYAKQLKFFHIDTLGDLQKMFDRNQEFAYKMLEDILKNNDLDILSSTIVLRSLCRAELIQNNYAYEDVLKFIKLSVSNNERAESMAERFMADKEKYNKSNL